MCKLKKVVIIKFYFLFSPSTSVTVYPQVWVTLLAWESLQLGTPRPFVSYVVIKDLQR